MKTSLTKLKSSFFVALFISLSATAKPVAQVTEIKGQVFAMSPEGKTVGLKVNDHLDDKTEIMVEEGGSLTLNNYYDATYHLIGGTQLKLFDKSAQLKRGKTWIESKNTRHPLAITTANGNVDFWKAEFIVTFDTANSRTQVLVVNGEVDVSNILDKNMKTSVTAGTFTLIDPEIESGSPRASTKVGLNSLNQALAEFKQLPESLKVVSAPQEAVAPIPAATASVKRGEIIFIDTKGHRQDRLPASVSGAAQQYFKQKTQIKKVTLSPAPIRFYGMRQVDTGIRLTPRKPASTAVDMPIAGPGKVEESMNRDVEFESSLKIQTDQQPKYSKELDNLIQDLKSY